MPAIDELKQEIDKLQQEVVDINKHAVQIGGYGILVLIIITAAAYLVFCNISTMFEDGGSKVGIGFGLLILAGVISIFLRKKLRRYPRELIVVKNAELAAKKGELEKLLSEEMNREKPDVL